MQAVEEDDFACQRAADLLVHGVPRPRIGEEADGPTAQLRRAVAGEMAGRLVRVTHSEGGRVVGVHQEHGVVKTVADSAEELLALPQGLLGSDAAISLNGEGDEVPHRARERLLIGAPLSRRPDVFVAHDAGKLSALIERRVEQRRDAPRL